jgi:hypothetical protein
MNRRAPKKACRDSGLRRTVMKVRSSFHPGTTLLSLPETPVGMVPNRACRKLSMVFWCAAPLPCSSSCWPAPFTMSATSMFWEASRSSCSSASSSTSK